MLRNLQDITAERFNPGQISVNFAEAALATVSGHNNLEFDELKRDTGFVRDLGFDTATHVLVEGLLSMAAGLGVQVVAEGVESEDQGAMLRALGCRFV